MFTYVNPGTFVLPIIVSFIIFEGIKIHSNKTKARLKLRKCILSRIKNQPKSISGFTNFITTNESTIKKYFNIEKDVLLLSNPEFHNSKLCFDSIPYLQGSSFQLINQENKFERNSISSITPANQFSNIENITREETKQIILCDKNQFFNSMRSLSLKQNFAFVSISDADTRIEVNETKDNYIILLIVVTNHQNGIKEKKINRILRESTIMSLKDHKEPNIRSTNGKKHNMSYGQYYGFGLTNKYIRSDNGLTFGHFRRNWDTSSQENNNLESKVRIIFNSLAATLNSILPGSINAGNNAIKSLIDIGRNKSKNKSFKEVTKSNKFGNINQQYHSIWLCENARTELFHQELDSSYTMIAVPYYDDKLSKKCSVKYKFQFKWCLPTEKNTKGIDFNLDEGTCLFYNGLGLFHRQIPNGFNFESSTFWNFSMYHNERLWNTIYQSIHK